MFRVAAFASAAVLASTADAFTVTMTNGCSGDIELYTRLASIYTDESETIASGASVAKTIEKGYEGHFRNGSDDAATLIEFATMGDLDLAWFDVGIIPPRLDAGYEYCTSLQECQQHSDSGIGFNTPVQVTPTSNTNGDNCRELTCLADGCEDAYNYPKDDTKTHSCTFGTDFVVTFCPSGDSSMTTQQTSSSSASTTQDATQQDATQQDTTQQDTTQQDTTQQDTTQQDTTQETTAPETTTPATTAPVVTEAPATTTPAVTDAPATEAPATDAPVQQSTAASDDSAGTVHTQDDGVNGEAETTAPEVTPAATPAATKSKYCV